jgi:parvulin-like peptidyl-prolyl isomerase
MTTRGTHITLLRIAAAAAIAAGIAACDRGGRQAAQDGTSAQPAEKPTAPAEQAAKATADAAPGSLVAPPAEDSEGPVIARFGGGEIHAGEVMRNMGNLSSYQGALLQADQAEFEKFVNSQIDRHLLYRAALDAGLQKAPDIGERLFDFQRTLVTERYSQAERAKGETVTDAEASEFFEKNKDRFGEPSRIAIAFIKRASQADAEASLEKLRAGAVFGDVATSDSVDAGTARTRGMCGSITEKDNFIPGIGPAPAVAEKLRQMNANDITGVTQIGDAFYIFKVMGKTEKKAASFEETKSQITAILRARKRQQAAVDLGGKLREKYGLRVERAGLTEFWNAAKAAAPTTGTQAGAAATSPTAVR